MMMKFVTAPGTVVACISAVNIPYPVAKVELISAFMPVMLLTCPSVLTGPYTTEGVGCM